MESHHRALTSIEFFIYRCSVFSRKTFVASFNISFTFVKTKLIIHAGIFNIIILSLKPQNLWHLCFFLPQADATGLVRSPKESERKM